MPGKIHFGVYELDPEAMELRKHGVLIRLQEQPLRVLIALAERPGEIVTREELQAKIWGKDTFVDFEQSTAGFDPKAWSHRARGSPASCKERLWPGHSLVDSTVPAGQLPGLLIAEMQAQLVHRLKVAPVPIRPHQPSRSMRVLA